MSDRYLAATLVLAGHLNAGKLVIRGNAHRYNKNAQFMNRHLAIYLEALVLLKKDPVRRENVNGLLRIQCWFTESAQPWHVVEQVSGEPCYGHNISCWRSFGDKGDVDLMTLDSIAREWQRRDRLWTIYGDQVVVTRSEAQDDPESEHPSMGRWLKRLNRFLGVMGMLTCNNEGRPVDKHHDHRTTSVTKMTGLLHDLEKPLRSVRW